MKTKITMIDDTVYQIVPEKSVLDFLNYIQKETPVRFDFPSLTGKYIKITSEVNELNTTFSLPVKVYYINTMNPTMEVVIRYCPCEFCRKIVSVQLLINNNTTEIRYSISIIKYFKKAIPDLNISIAKKPEPLFIKNNPADFLK
jgi:hypothetical protein